MTRFLVTGLLGRSEHDNLHAAFLGLESHVDVYSIDTRVREDPDYILLIEIPALHDGLAVTLGTLQEQELMDTHLTYDVCEEGQRKFAQGVETYESADTGIHLLDRQIGVAASESMYPTTCLDRIGHYFGYLLDFLHLGCFDFVHNGLRVTFPFVC